VLVVSVWEVIEPCVKFGTTGTAREIDGTNAQNKPTLRAPMIFFIIIYTHYLIVISDTNCPVAEVPAPPAVNDTTPAELIVPAREPATPPAVVVTLPNAGKDGATPLVMVVLLGIASPWLKVSLKEKALPSVVWEYVPAFIVAAAAPEGAVRPPRVAETLEPLTE
jgi:hypothetical protein